MTSVEEKIPMKTNTFDIKVAFIGYVSVGKSTVLNALLGDKFSEVALKRTTAGVNFFRVSQPFIESGGHLKKGWSTVADDTQLKEAEDVHNEISIDNKELRLSDTVGEKTFDVQVSFPISEMRNDTQLVLVDIPGINEADSSKKYKDYVKTKWRSFDCVVVVMDAIQGVNTQEQVDLLKFVHRLNQDVKDIPTIVLGNKMDDLEDEDTKCQINDTYSKIVEIFGAVDCCSVVRSAELPDSNIKGDMTKTAFVPLSAKNAYTYMKAGCIDLGKLHNPKYLDLVNKIGQDEYGRKWNRMKSEKKIATVREIIKDTAELEERLSSTNFISFISSLSKFIGGNHRQTEILTKQMDMQLENLNIKALGEKPFADSILKAFTTSKAIGKVDVINLQNKFWNAYYECNRCAYKEMESQVNPAMLERPFVELEKYYELTMALGWQKESSDAISQMRAFVESQAAFLLNKIETWSFKSYCLASGLHDMTGKLINRIEHQCEQCRCNRYIDGRKPFCNKVVCENLVYFTCSPKSMQMQLKRRGWYEPPVLTWENLSPNDWIVILSSISIVWNEDLFFHDKIDLNYALSKFNGTFNTFTGIHSDAFSMDDSTRICLHAYRVFHQTQDPRITLQWGTRIKIPETMAHPSNWGFLAWKYTNFCERKLNRGSKRKSTEE